MAPFLCISVKEMRGVAQDEKLPGKKQYCVLDHTNGRNKYLFEVHSLNLGKEIFLKITKCLFLCIIVISNSKYLTGWVLYRSVTRYSLRSL